MIFFEKTKKNAFLDKVNGSMCAKFQVCIVFRVARRRDTITYINKYINTQIYIEYPLPAARLTRILIKNIKPLGIIFLSQN